MAKRHIAQIEVMDEDEVIQDTDKFFAKCAITLQNLVNDTTVKVVVDEINSFDDDCGT